MPITPLHFGPGIALKALLAGAFSFTVFALANILIDMEPVVRVLIGAPAIPPLAAWTGALLGAWSHVALDSIMHPDMDPLWPFAPGNGLLGILSLDALHLLCVGLGVLGVGALVLLRVIR
jgi:hypothetical protein